MSKPVVAAAESALVGIVRDFLRARRKLDALAELRSRGELRFADVEGFVGDDERSVLYRLKEHCHALFRTPLAGTAPVRMGELFDLAVGSLFHEAMKLRENVYQQEVYAPRVESLRRSAGDDADSLILEFEKIIGSAGERVIETFDETRALFELTLAPLRRLLVDHRETGHLTRFLVEHRETVSEVFPEGLEDLLVLVHGSLEAAYGAAIHSYLESAHFEKARELIGSAGERCTLPGEFEALAEYASGMVAFLGGDYGASLDHLEAWVSTAVETGDVSPCRERERGYVDLAHGAVARLPKIADSEAEAPLLVRGRALEKSLAKLLADG